MKKASIVFSSCMELHDWNRALGMACCTYRGTMKGNDVTRYLGALDHSIRHSATLTSEKQDHSPYAETGRPGESFPGEGSPLLN